MSIPKPSLSDRTIAIVTTAALHLLLLLLLVSGLALHGADIHAGEAPGELVVEASITPQHSRVAKALPVERKDASKSNLPALPSAPTSVEAPRGNERANSNQPASPARSDDSFQIGSFSDESDFERRLLAHIERFRHYPDRAKVEKLVGQVSVTFTMDRAGNVLAIAVTGPSGSPLLDTEAVNTVLRAQPLPAIPTNLPDKLEVELPVSFDATQLGTVAVAQ